MAVGCNADFLASLDKGADHARTSVCLACTRRPLDRQETAQIRGEARSSLERCLAYLLERLPLGPWGGVHEQVTPGRGRARTLDARGCHRLSQPEASLFQH